MIVSMFHEIPLDDVSVEVSDDEDKQAEGKIITLMFWDLYK